VTRDDPDSPCPTTTEITTMKLPNHTVTSSTTYLDCATDWQKWCDHVDPNGTVTQKEFDNMTTAEKLTMIEDSFGPESL
jgi:uncharacterized glyoxalase superfamily protein PhnB